MAVQLLDFAEHRALIRWARRVDMCGLEGWSLPDQTAHSALVRRRSTEARWVGRCLDERIEPGGREFGDGSESSTRSGVGGARDD